MQIAIAAPSLAAVPRALTVRRTALIHLQNLDAKFFRLVPIAISIMYPLTEVQSHGGQSFDKCARRPVRRAAVLQAIRRTW